MAHAHQHAAYATHRTLPASETKTTISHQMGTTLPIGWLMDRARLDVMMSCKLGISQHLMCHIFSVIFKVETLLTTCCGRRGSPIQGDSNPHCHFPLSVLDISVNSQAMSRGGESTGI